MGSQKVVKLHNDFKKVPQTLAEIQEAVDDGSLLNLVTIMRRKDPETGQVEIGWTWQGQDTFVTYLGMLFYTAMGMYQSEHEGFIKNEEL